MVAAPWGQ